MTQTISQSAGARSSLARVLVGFDSADVLAYSHLEAATVPTLLVDNASRDSTLEVAGNLGYETLEMGYNAGYARAVNAGLRQLDAEFVLVTNPDLRIGVEDIAALVAAARCYDDADIFVPRIFKPDGSEFFRSTTRFEPRRRDCRSPEGDACVCVFSGAVMLVRRQSFMRHGGFDENIFLYFEDDDLSLRWYADKRPIIFVSAASAQHLGARSSAYSKSNLRLRHQAFGWSWAYVMRKHGVRKILPAITLTAGKLVAHGLILQFGKARRDAAILAGLVSGAIGRQATFPF